MISHEFHPFVQVNQLMQNAKRREPEITLLFITPGFVSNRITPSCT